MILAGAGGRAHAAAGRVIARGPFAGYWEYLLDDAIITEPAHPHWSGAALIGAGGELMGIGSLSLQRQRGGGGVIPINMFVPSELLPPILDDLARGKVVHPPRPWLGVLAQDVGANVVVIDISPRGPAARADLRSGDVDPRGRRRGDRRAWPTSTPNLWSARPGRRASIPLTIQRERDVFEVEIRSADRAAMLKKRKLN